MFSLSDVTMFKNIQEKLLSDVDEESHNESNLWIADSSNMHQEDYSLGLSHFFNRALSSTSDEFIT